MATLAKSIAVSPVTIVASTNSVVEGSVVGAADALTATWPVTVGTSIVARLAIVTS